MDRNPHPGRKRLETVAVRQGKTAVDAVHGPGPQFIHHFQAGNQLESLSFHRADQEPFRSIVDKREPVRHLRQRGRERAAGIPEPLDDRPRPEIVRKQRKLVGPALERILHIAVHDHVLRQSVQRQPVGRIRLEGRLDVRVQDVQPDFDPPAEVPGGRLRIRMAPVHQQGHPHQESGHAGEDGTGKRTGMETDATHGDKVRL